MHMTGPGVLTAAADAGRSPECALPGVCCCMQSKRQNGQDERNTRLGMATRRLVLCFTWCSLKRHAFARECSVLQLSWPHLYLPALPATRERRRELPAASHVRSAPR